MDVATGSNPDAVIAQDLNGNGRMDLVTADGSGTVTIMLGAPSFTFLPPTHVAIGTDARSVAAGDFNEDGKLDLAVSADSPGSVAILLGNGDGTFAAPVFLPTGLGCYGVAVADLDGDGHLDVAAANQGVNTASILRGRGDGTFDPRVDFFVDYGPEGVAIADMDEDGRPDVLVTNPALRHNGQTVVILLNRATFPTGVEGPEAVWKLSLAVAANPARGSANVECSIPLAGRVRVEVFDAAGQRIRVLHEAQAAAGILRLAWDGRTAAGSSVGPGLYWVRASIGERSAQRKLVWLGQ